MNVCTLYASKIRCRLWADLAKTARKQNVWDVASSSAVFCLVHDDLSSKLSEGGKDPKLERKQSERLSSSHLTKKGSSPKLESRRSTSPFYAAASELRVGAASSHSVASRKRGDRDVTRLLAEIHCLYAEVRTCMHILTCTSIHIYIKGYSPCFLRNS